jgi:predicted nucleotidyltransferase
MTSAESASDPGTAAVEARHNALIKSLARRIGACRGVERVILYGSRARGDHRLRSDIDLAVTGVTDDDIWTEICALADSAPTLLGIDLVRLEKAGAALRENILREGKILHDR